MVKIETITPVSDFELKTLSFFDSKPYLFTFGNTILTQWFPINDAANVERLRKIDGLQVDSRRMLVRRVHVI